MSINIVAKIYVINKCIEFLAGKFNNFGVRLILMDRKLMSKLMRWFNTLVFLPISKESF